MLWQLDNTAFHILGSVHVSNRPLQLSETATNVLKNATVSAFEANLDASPSLASKQYKRGDTLNKHITASLFADTQRVWHEFTELEDEELERLQPWWVAFCLGGALMSRHGFDQERGVDRRIFNIGKKERKDLFYFESINDGLASFAYAPLTEQVNFLSRIPQNTEEYMREVEALVSVWEGGDPNSLLPIVEKALQQMPIAYSAALGGRNKSWLKQILRLARSGKNTVAVVGMLHMVGPDSIPSLLTAEGFTFSLVG